MNPIYTIAEFEAAKSRDLLPLKCVVCDTTFYLPKNEIMTAKSGHHSNRDTCSQECANAKKRNRTNVSCSQCGRSFHKTPCQIQQGGNNFCSRSCSTTWRNLHKHHGIRRSRLEKWLEGHIVTLYPHLEFQFNHKDAIGSELDIYVPSLRLAFELNGIYHYEPIHGQDKLSRVKNNDRRKFAACYEHGIELCIIDVSTLSYFKEQRAMRFLVIIQDIINSRLSGS